MKIVQMIETFKSSYLSEANHISTDRKPQALGKMSKYENKNNHKIWKANNTHSRKHNQTIVYCCFYKTYILTVYGYVSLYHLKPSNTLPFFQSYERLRADNNRLKEENKALTRVVSKLSK